MPVIMRDEMTGPMARQAVNIISQYIVSGYGLGQPRGWSINLLGFTTC
jgi:hypothetical protein